MWQDFKARLYSLSEVALFAAVLLVFNSFFVFSVTRLWENKNVVGQLEKSTTGDYKNQGYYSMQARIFNTDVLNKF